MSEEHATYDVFVSYASDDKKFVQQLVPALRAKGVSVWYDEGQLRVGDAALRKVEEGLEQSKYFVVVASPKFLSHQWTSFEVGVALGRGRGDHILPIYLQSEMAMSLPILGAKRGISAEDHSIDEIAEFIATVVKGEGAVENDS
jgi:hypothetical protein